MNLNAIPILGWFLDLFFSTSLAVPFYFLWNHLCPKYMPFIHAPYNDLPFWDCVWLFMLIGILKSTLVPKLADVTQNNGDKK